MGLFVWRILADYVSMSQQFRENQTECYLPIEGIYFNTDEHP